MLKVALFAALSATAAVALSSPNYVDGPLDLIPTPFGMVPRTCVHKVENGAHIEEGHHSKEGAKVGVPGKKAHTLYPRDICQQWKNNKRANNTTGTGNLKQYDGWLAYTTFHHPPGIDYFGGFFSVPESPASSPQILYLFTGLQNVDWIPIVDPEPQVFDIIQPVLQYSYGSWEVKNWYVTLGSDVLYSDAFSTSPGDNIFGNMTKIGSEKWYIGAYSQKNPASSCSLTVSRPRLASQPWAYNTAECYGCCGCACEPTNSCVFSKLVLKNKGQVVTPAWVPHTTPNKLCREKAVVNSPSEVTLSFH
jgi:hypothetical protein